MFEKVLYHQYLQYCDPGNGYFIACIELMSLMLLVFVETLKYIHCEIQSEVTVKKKKNNMTILYSNCLFQLDGAASSEGTTLEGKCLGLMKLIKCMSN